MLSCSLAVAACPHPVVSAIGHQTDFAITDFVADVRAPTPSAAAEMITPTRADLLSDLGGLQARLNRGIQQELRYLGQTISTLDARLLDPATQIAQKMMQVDELEQRLLRGQANRAATRRGRLAVPD